MRGRAEVDDPLGGTAHRLEFGTLDSTATIFSGTLYDFREEEHGQDYVIEMSRS